MRVFAISDLHADSIENWKSLQQLSLWKYREDVVIVAGDIADSLSIIAKTLWQLRIRFRQVFYVPGNHELWTRTEDCHSIEKFARVLALCNEIGVWTSPAKVNDVWVVPLFSWYDQGADDYRSPRVAGLECWADYYFCKWPPEISSIAEYFLNLNLPHIRSYDGAVITLSHFLPRRDLLPETSKLKFNGLPHVAVCDALDFQVRSVNSIIHVFGHSHINCDCMIDGVRYVQSTLGYPRENRSLHNSLKVILASDAQQSTEQLESAAFNSSRM
jgi:predicted phosphodiesterase